MTGICAHNRHTAAQISDQIGYRVQNCVFGQLVKTKNQISLNLKDSIELKQFYLLSKGRNVSHGICFDHRKTVDCKNTLNELKFFIETIFWVKEANRLVH